MTNKIIIPVIFATLVFTFACDRMGITKHTENEEKQPQLLERILENSQNAALLQKQVIDLETEISRLNSIIVESDTSIKSLQGQLASSEALVQNMQTEIRSAKKTKTILSVVAVISLIFNALFLWIIFGNKKRETRLALPPAREETKKDIDIMKYSPTPPSSEKDKNIKNNDTLTKAQMASGKTSTSVSAKHTTTKKSSAKQPVAKTLTAKPAPQKTKTIKTTSKKVDEPENENNQ